MSARASCIVSTTFFFSSSLYLPWHVLPYTLSTIFTLPSLTRLTLHPAPPFLPQAVVTLTIPAIMVERCTQSCPIKVPFVPGYSSLQLSRWRSLTVTLCRSGLPIAILITIINCQFLLPIPCSLRFILRSSFSPQMHCLRR